MNQTGGKSLHLRNQSLQSAAKQRMGNKRRNCRDETKLGGYQRLGNSPGELAVFRIGEIGNLTEHIDHPRNCAEQTKQGSDCGSDCDQGYSFFQPCLAVDNDLVENFFQNFRLLSTISLSGLTQKFKRSSKIPGKGNRSMREGNSKNLE